MLDIHPQPNLSTTDESTTLNYEYYLVKAKKIDCRSYHIAVRVYNGLEQQKWFGKQEDQNVTRGKTEWRFEAQILCYRLPMDHDVVLCQLTTEPSET